MTIWLVQYSLD